MNSETNEIGRNRQGTSHKTRRAGIVGLAVVAFLAMPAPAFAQDAAEVGKQFWHGGGCAGCHGRSGHGGHGGAGSEQATGPSVRSTELDRDQLIELISCGRPGTPMPAWLAGAYTETACYGLEPGPAPAGTGVSGAFDADEIEALVDYLLAEIVQN